MTLHDVSEAERHVTELQDESMSEELKNIWPGFKGRTSPGSCGSGSPQKRLQQEVEFASLAAPKEQISSAATSKRPVSDQY